MESFVHVTINLFTSLSYNFHKNQPDKILCIHHPLSIKYKLPKLCKNHVRESKLLGKNQSGVTHDHPCILAFWWTQVGVDVYPLYYCQLNALPLPLSDNTICFTLYIQNVAYIKRYGVGSLTAIILLRCNWLLFIEL